MKKNLLEIYALAVCFAAVLCFTITLGIAAYDVIEIGIPQFTMSTYDFERFQTNQKFVDSWRSGKPVPSDEDVTRLREQGLQAAIRYERRSAMQSLLQTSIIMIIDSIVFLIHWSMAKRQRNQAP